MSDDEIRAAYEGAIAALNGLACAMALYAAALINAGEQLPKTAQDERVIDGDDE